MKPEEFKNFDATGLAALVKGNQVSPRELTETAYEVILKENPLVNAVTHLRLEEARIEAENADVTAPFGGVPILLKDMSQYVKGSPATAGSKLLAQNKAAHTSHFVRRLKNAGFIILGHTNAPEFGLKNITEPVLHGASKNPLNHQYSPGGSSGGAAAALASGMVPVAGASDGGGSIRIPASFTGLIGLKPSRGRVPVGPGTGRQWQGAAIDFFLTKSIRDTAQLLDSMQVFQKEAAFHIPLYEAGYLNTRNVNRKYRVAFSTDSPVGTPVSEEARIAVYKAVKLLEEAGFDCKEAVPAIDGKQLIEQYYLMNSGEMASLIHNLEQALGRILTHEDMEIESWALSQAGLKLSAGEFSRSLAAWDQASAVMHQFHETYDLYITPAAAHIAPKLGELNHSENMTERLKQISSLPSAAQQHLIYEMFEPSLTYTPYTQLANLTGQPAISLPIHQASNGMPIGVQIIAPKGNEHWLIQTGHLLMNAVKG
ncbi:amidase [Jeotgalibacillus sp. R-1-5s-1]|uniref:amidase n=1 Tax=Jeotgalibacillus sp. R-1-5s-1 TaxID=2555897 RepID=UPI00106D42F0|nr:amidase [Jeotgalibacillus sp. R-1-5s-1]TFE03379.1 amidase [Jeotgalibacillus sp. R-1-5s-1]